MNGFVTLATGYLKLSNDPAYPNSYWLKKDGLWKEPLGGLENTGGSAKTTNSFLKIVKLYDPSICDGLYESHVNFFVVAESFEDARAKAKAIAEFQSKKMHVDGLKEIKMVNGYKLQLQADVLKTSTPSNKFFPMLILQQNI